MNDVRWSDNELRTFIEAESHVTWFSDASEREDARARFTREARTRIVPVVQARLLERVGAVSDPEGIAMVACDLTSDLCCRDDARRWLLVTVDPWDHLTEWISSQLVKSYRATVGKTDPSRKRVKRILAD